MEDGDGGPGPPPLDEALARRKSKQEEAATGAEGSAQGASPPSSQSPQIKEAWSPEEKASPPSVDDAGSGKKPKEMSERARRIQAPLSPPLSHPATSELIPYPPSGRNGMRRRWPKRLKTPMP